MGLWTDGRPHVRNLGERISRNLLLQTKPNENGVGKDSRAARLARAELIPVGVCLHFYIFFTFYYNFRIRRYIFPVISIYLYTCTLIFLRVGA